MINECAEKNLAIIPEIQSFFCRRCRRIYFPNKYTYKGALTFFFIEQPHRKSGAEKSLKGHQGHEYSLK